MGKDKMSEMVAHGSKYIADSYRENQAKVVATQMTVDEQ